MPGLTAGADCACGDAEMLAMLVRAPDLSGISSDTMEPSAAAVAPAACSGPSLVYCLYLSMNLATPVYPSPIPLPPTSAAVPLIASLSSSATTIPKYFFNASTLSSSIANFTSMTFFP